MAVVAISALSASTTIATADVLPAVVSGATKKITAGNLRAQMFAFAATDPLNCGALTAVGASSITGALTGVTTFACTSLTNTGGYVYSNAGGGNMFGSTASLTNPVYMRFQNTGGFFDIAMTGNVASQIFTGDTAYGAALGTQNATKLHFATNGVVRLTVDTTGSLIFTTAASKILPGATSLSLRNNADSADNFILTDAGNATLRGTLTFATASGKVIPGATQLSFRNNADGADNLLITDAGAATIRGGLTVSAGNLVLTGSQLIQINGNNVVGPRAAGWVAQTTAQSRADLGAAPAAAAVYQTLAALIMDLRAHGLI